MLTKVERENRERFINITTKRLNKIRDIFVLISNLSIRPYNFTSKEAEYYFTELNKRICILKESFVKSRSSKSRYEISAIEIMADLELYCVEGKPNATFHKLMVARINRIVDVLRLLLNQSNRSHYFFYQNDITQIIAYLNALKEVTESQFIGLKVFKIEEKEESEYQVKRR